MKMNEVKELATKDLIERLESTKNELVRMKVNHAVTPMENPNKIKETRRDIARMLTELNRRTQQEN